MPFFPDCLPTGSVDMMLDKSGTKTVTGFDVDFEMVSLVCFLSCLGDYVVQLSI